jgi:hypothetical protein
MPICSHPQGMPLVELGEPTWRMVASFPRAVVAPEASLGELAGGHASIALFVEVDA